MTNPNTDAVGLLAEDREWLEWTLKRGLPVGHCGESTSEAISRGRAEDRVNRVLAALSVPTPNPPAIQGASDTVAAAAIYKHFCDHHGLHPDEASDATGELLAALAASQQPAVSTEGGGS